MRTIRGDSSARFIEALSLAMILEASGYPKPGNVHRLADRKTLRYEAFLATGVLAYKYFKKGFRRGFRKRFGKTLFGDLVYGLVNDVIEHLRSSNTCLGSSLLLSLMSTSIGLCLKHGFNTLTLLSECAKEVINKTTVWDTIYYYKAIRKALPSYLKETDNTGEYVNVWDSAYRRKILEKGHRLVDVLKYSSRFDVVAEEAITGFEQGIKVEEFLRERLTFHFNLNRAIVETYLYLLSRNIDTVVYLKYGYSSASTIMEKAKRTFNIVTSADNNEWLKPVMEFDNELQEKNINPGAIADLTAEVIALYMIRNVIEGRKELLDLSY